MHLWVSQSVARASQCMYVCLFARVDDYARVSMYLCMRNRSRARLYVCMFVYVRESVPTRAFLFFYVCINASRWRLYVRISVYVRDRCLRVHFCVSLYV